MGIFGKKKPSSYCGTGVFLKTDESKTDSKATSPANGNQATQSCCTR